MIAYLPPQNIEFETLPVSVATARTQEDGGQKRSPLIESKGSDDGHFSDEEHKDSAPVTTNSSPVVEMMVPVEVSTVLDEKVKTFLINKTSQFQSSPRRAGELPNPIIVAVRNALSQLPLDTNSPEAAFLQYVIQLHQANEFEACLANFHEHHIAGAEVFEGESINYKQIEDALTWMRDTVADAVAASAAFFESPSEAQITQAIQASLITQRRSETFEKLVDSLAKLVSPFSKNTILDVTVASGKRYAKKELESDTRAILEKLEALALDNQFSDNETESLGSREENEFHESHSDERHLHDQEKGIQLVSVGGAAEDSPSKRLSIDSLRSVSPALLQNLSTPNKGELTKYIKHTIIKVLEDKSFENADLTALNRAIFSQTSDLSFRYPPLSEDSAGFATPLLVLCSEFPGQIGAEVKNQLFALLLKQSITEVATGEELCLGQLDPTPVSSLDLDALAASIKACFTDVLSARLPEA